MTYGIADTEFEEFDMGEKDRGVMCAGADVQLTTQENRFRGVYRFRGEVRGHPSQARDLANYERIAQQEERGDQTILQL